MAPSARASARPSPAQERPPAACSQTLALGRARGERGRAPQGNASARSSASATRAPSASPSPPARAPPPACARAWPPRGSRSASSRRARRIRGVASALHAAADQWVTGEGGGADAADGARPYRRIFWTTREYQGAATAMTLRHGGRAFRDAPSRVVTAPKGRALGQLMAAADTLGRVTLVDTRVAPMLIIRLWKGLREAGVGWLTSPLVAASEPAPAMSADADAPPLRGSVPRGSVLLGGCLTANVSNRIRSSAWFCANGSARATRLRVRTANVSKLPHPRGPRRPGAYLLTTRASSNARSSGAGGRRERVRTANQLPRCACFFRRGRWVFVLRRKCVPCSHPRGRRRLTDPPKRHSVPDYPGTLKELDSAKVPNQVVHGGYPTLAFLRPQSVPHLGSNLRAGAGRRDGTLEGERTKGVGDGRRGSGRQPPAPAESSGVSLALKSASESFSGASQAPRVRRGG